MLCDFDNMDLFTMEQKILEVKELLKFLNEEYHMDSYFSDTLPYFNGSSLLSKSANFVDGLIHGEYPEETELR